MPVGMTDGPYTLVVTGGMILQPAQQMDTIMTRNTTHFRPAALIAILVAAGVVPSLTHAQALTDDQGFRIQKVSFDDLDPTQPAGMKILVRRIHIAAENVCGPMPEPMQNPVEAKAVTACMKTAEHNAIAFIQRTAIMAKTAPKGGQKLAEVKSKP